MVVIQKASSGQGAFFKNSEIISGSKCKIVSEATKIEGQFGMQLVARLRFQGGDEAKNVNVNSASMNGLIDAFGADTADWQGNILTAITEKMVVSGKRVTALYLVPEGFELGEDAGGYVQIKKKEIDIPVVNVDEAPPIKDSDLPF